MSLPTQMTDRWQDREEPGAGEGTVYWHMLMRDYPEVTGLARQAQQQLAPFATGLHMTPLNWLHMTTLVAGPVSSFSDEQLQQMTQAGAEQLANIAPVTVTVGRILYHPEAIMLGVTPANALLPVHQAAAAATQSVTGQHDGQAPEPWIPHITICYSTADQPARPLIDALGLELPSREVQISAVQLVIQHGPERLWDWDVISTITLHPPDEAHLRLWATSLDNVRREN
jgi:2'-5' RNA ligase